MVINNPNNLRFSTNLVDLLGVNPALTQITAIKRLTSPITYFIHCDLLDKEQNLLNGKPSTVLPDLTFMESHLKEFITKQQNNISCVTSRLVIMQTA